MRIFPSLMWLCCAGVLTSAAAPRSEGAPRAKRSKSAQSDAFPTRIEAGGELAMPEAVATGTRGLVLSQILADTLTPKQAWSAGSLSAQDAEELLERKAPPPGFDRVHWASVCLELGGVLALHCEQTRQDPLKLKARSRLHVADYYRSRKDARAVALYESLIGDLESSVESQGIPGADWRTVDPLIHLAMYYAETRQFEKSAQTWLRGPRYWKNPSFLADLTWEAARRYGNAGQHAKAQELYSQVGQYGNALFDSLIVYRQANAMMEKGRLQEALLLLQRPIQGDRAEEAKVGIYTLLGECHYRMGNFKAAGQAASQALEIYRSLPQTQMLARAKMRKNITPLPSGGSVGLETMSRFAQKCLQWSQVWEQQTLAVEPKLLQVPRGGRTAGEKATLRFVVRSYRPLNLTVASDQALVTARFVPPEVRTGRYFFEREVEVEVAPQALERGQGVAGAGGKPGLLAHLTLHSTSTTPNAPAVELRVPVEIAAFP